MIFSYSTGHSSAADGSIIYVNCSSGNDINNGYTWETAKLTIKNATGTVLNDGTVTIASGTYSGTGNTNISINKNITITGKDQNNTIIDAQRANNIFNIPLGVKITINNLTLKNGDADNGGAIKNFGNLNLTNITFQNNTANRGGAIYNDDGTIIISNSTFTNNNATERGGAICSDGTATISNNMFTDNNAPNGGGIYHEISFFTGVNNSFIHNTANYGGAIFNNVGDITENGTVFNQNIAYYHGGGIYNGNGDLTESNNTYSHNTATNGNGGAIFNTGNVTDTLITFSNNTAAVLGGAIYNNGGNVTGNNNTFTQNVAYWGGAIYNIASTVSENDNVFSQNHATWGGGAIYNDGFLGNPLINIINNTFNYNTANYGGAIYNINATLIGSQNTFTGNNATINGGALYNDVNSTISTINSTFTDNTAINGGANYNKGNALSESNNSFIHNTANYGGAIYNNNCSMTENKNLFSENGATISGGAIYNSNSDLTESNNTYSHNTATNGNGGAIFNTGNVTGTFITFQNNTATNGNGGAIYNVRAGNLTGNYNIFTQNSANWGGAIYNLGTITDNNNSFNQNNATISGGGIYNDVDSTLTENSTIFQNNTVSAGNGGAIYNKGNIIINFNRIVGNSNYDIYNYFQGSTSDARYNWWGTNFSGSNPIAASRINSGLADIWMVLSINASPQQIPVNGTSNITINLLNDSNGTYHPARHVPDGILVTFATSLGTINSPLSTLNGIANATLQVGVVSGVADVSATVDSQTSHTSVTVDSTSPIVISTNPAQYAVNLPPNQVFTVTFSEAITAANLNIIILKTSTGTIITTTKTINGNVLTITPNNPLTEAKYLLLLYAGCVTDLAGNPSVAITRTYSVGAQPYVTSTDPANYAINVPTNKIITATFNEPILAKYLTLIYLKTATGGIQVATTKSVSGNILTITPTSPLATNTRYLLLIYTFAVTDLSGNSNSNKAITFTTGAT